MTRTRHYADILNDLFDPTPYMHQDRLFEFVCTLVRAGGIQGPGWDPWLESKAVIDDLQNLAKLELPREKFPDLERTQARLALLSYCHITEMDLPYVLLANLLRLRLGRKYSMSPFSPTATARLLCSSRNGVTYHCKPDAEGSAKTLNRKITFREGMNVTPTVPDSPHCPVRNRPRKTPLIGPGPRRGSAAPHPRNRDRIGTRRRQGRATDRRGQT
jgi:hypothetical protein